MVMKKKQSKKKQKIDELQSAEEKFQALVAKRDEFHLKAQSVRVERDALNEKKKELRNQIDDLRDERRALSAKVADHKEKRDELQSKAKSMIDIKKKLRTTVDNDAKMTLTTAKREMRKLEMEYQTIPRPLEEEAVVIKRIKKLYEQITQLEKLVKDQKEIKMSISEVDDVIDEAFKLANNEHRQLMVYVEQRKAIDEKVRDIVNEISIVIGAGDKKHQEYMDLRAAADHQHTRAKELRDKILEIRATKRKERDEERKAISDLNAASRKELQDKDKLDKAADSALEKLLAKGKIEL